MTKMKNPCEGCKRVKNPAACTGYKGCSDYRFWINWNWAMFRGYPQRMALRREESQQDCTYNKNGHCMGQKLMPECDAKNCDRRKK